MRGLPLFNLHLQVYHLPSVHKAFTAQNFLQKANITLLSQKAFYTESEKFLCFFCLK